MIYKYYTTIPLLQQAIEKEEDVIYVISDITFRQILRNNNLKFVQKIVDLKDRRKLEVFYDYKTSHIDEILAAARYDRLLHPDETVIVVPREHVGTANLFFGEDSIEGL